VIDQAEFTDDTTALYRLWNEAGSLLYVGISHHPRMRFEQHAVEKPWWPEVARKTVTWHGTRAEASDAETTAIQEEHPRYNAPRRPAGREAERENSTAKYRQMERKELLIWPEQITDLSILMRQINRSRGGEGERITINTLIRVAVTLLLSRCQDLTGSTEEELRHSLGLPD
jgi:predicted GIY-YIG superfamily endonuclease